MNMSVERPYSLLSIGNAATPKPWLSSLVGPQKLSSYITTSQEIELFPSEASFLLSLDLCTLGSLSDKMTSYRFNYMKRRPALVTRRHNKYSEAFCNPRNPYLTLQERLESQNIFILSASLPLP